MAITVAQVEAILSIQTKGFDSVTSAIRQMSDNFEKSTGTMLTAINKLEAQYAGLGKAAQDSSKSVKSSSDDSERAWEKQAQAVFKATEAVKMFAAEASRKNASSGIVLELEKELESLTRTMTSAALTQSEFVQTNNSMAAAMNKANISLKDRVTWLAADTRAYKAEQAEIAKTTAMMATQENSLLRAKNQFESLSASILKNVKQEELAASLTAQLTAAYQNLGNQLSRPLNSQELAKYNIEFRGITNSISRSAGLTNGFQQGLSDMGKFATIAAGPLSGIASRLTAIAYIADQVGFKMAALGVAGTGLAVAWGLGVKSAANFETGIAKTAVAAGLSASQTRQLGASMMALSTQLMVPTEELNKISQAAAQAGVSGVENLTKFTKVVAELTRTTTLTADSASDALLSLALVTKTPFEQIGHLGDMITKVGQSSVGSESAVLELATEISKAGVAFGFTAEKAIAWAGALADVNQNSESAATAVVQSIQKMDKIIVEGGPAFHQLAQFIGMTDESLQKLADNKGGPEILQKFLEQVSLAKGSLENFQDLQAVGIINARSARVIEELITVLKKLKQHEEEAATAAGDLDSKFHKLSETANRQLEGVIVNLENIGKTMGGAILPPLTTMLSGIREITSATKAWADVFSILTLVGGTFLLKWAGAKGIGFLTDLIKSFGLAGAKATTDVAAMGAAETGIGTAAIEMGAGLDIAAIAVGGLTLALNALWPVMAVEAIVYAIGKIRELKDAAQAATDVNRAKGAGAYASDIQAAVNQGPEALGALRKKFLAGRDNAAGNLKKFQGLQEQTDTINANMVGGGSAADYTDQIKNAQAKFDQYAGALAATYEIAKKTADEITKNGPLVAISKDAQKALNSIDLQIQKVLDLRNELDILNSQGDKAFKIAKATDAASLANQSKLGGKKSPQEVLTDAQNSGLFNPSQLKPLSNAIDSKDANAIKAALVGLGSLLDILQGKFKVAGQEGDKAFNKIQEASDRARESTTKEIETAGNEYAQSNKLLDAAIKGVGEYEKALSEQRASAGIANLQEKLSNLTPKDLDAEIKHINKYRVELGQLPLAAKDIDKLAESWYSEIVASQEARRAAEELNQAQQSLLNTNRQLTEQNSKVKFDTSLIGMSDYDKAIAEAKYGARASLQNNIDKNNIQIDQVRTKIADPSTDDKARADDVKELNALLAINADILNNQIPVASKNAGDAIRDNLNAHKLIDPLIASMDTLRTSFVQFGVSAVMNFNSVGDAFRSLMTNLETAFLQNQVFGPMSDALFGSKGGTGGGLFGGGNGGAPTGGLFGNLFDSLFGKGKGGNSSNPLSFSSQGNSSFGDIENGGMFGTGNGSANSASQLSGFTGLGSYMNPMWVKSADGPLGLGGNTGGGGGILSKLFGGTNDKTLGASPLSFAGSGDVFSGTSKDDLMNLYKGTGGSSGGSSGGLLGGMGGLFSKGGIFSNIFGGGAGGAGFTNTLSSAFADSQVAADAASSVGDLSSLAALPDIGAVAGAAGDAGGIGDILGTLLSFAGFFDNGGVIQPGHWGIKSGMPEIIQGGTAGVSVSPLDNPSIMEAMGSSRTVPDDNPVYNKFDIHVHGATDVMSFIRSKSQLESIVTRASTRGRRNT